MDKQSSSGLNGAYVVALIVSLGTLGLGIYLASSTHNWTMLAAGAGSLVVVLISWPLAMLMGTLHDSAVERTDKALTTLNERFEEFSIMLNLISEQQLLSDRAKSVAFREKDSDALRRAIQEEILAQRWEAASSLVNEMEKNFGYKGEAEQFRKQIELKQQDVVRRQITEASAIVDRHVRGEAWTEAFQEAQKIAVQFAGHDIAANLPQEVENRRQAHKQQLIESWNDAVSRHDVDGAIEILKRLDGYLTPTEAEAYQETARGVFKEKLALLRTQFSLAVQDHKWSDALQIADVITRDFPNTQMAKEVRDMMDSLRARAGGGMPAAAVTS
ncbi:MAG TPA: hypothetical protein VHD56_14590 [Tepidisphaeraceae bacterium]|nr:hypothetical protein [Tepidisphaeraceae bacterium]